MITILKTIGSLAIMSAVALAPSQTNWQILYVKSGKSVTTWPNGGFPETPWLQNGTVMSAGMPQVMFVMGSASASTNGSVRVVGTWVGSGSAPTQQWVAISSTSSAGGLGSVTLGAIDNGLGDTLVANSNGATMSGVHLFKLAVNNGCFEKQLALLHLSRVQVFSTDNR